ncbi:MAG: O-antigen ligase family protein [Syntrophaceae bacterium]|nr:O-antigen ligase family protein [Syntrophaceae bacterium]
MSPLGQGARINPMLWGTVGYLFLFIFRPFEYWEWLGEWRIERVYMICLLIALTFWKGNRYVHHSITTAFIAFFMVICLSVFIAYRPEEAIWTAEEYLKLMVLYFVIITTVRTEGELRFLVIAFLAITGIYVGKSMWEFFVHGRHLYRMGIPRLIGIDKTYSDPNTFAATIVYSLPFAWALWKSESSKRIRKGLVLYGAMSIVAILLTGSRSGFVSLALLGIITWLRGRKKVLGLMALIILAVFSWQLLPQDLKLRYLTIHDKSINPSATESAQGRIEGLKNGFKLWVKSPLYGWGAGNFRYAVEKIGVYDRMQAHNLYGQLAGDLGMFGMMAFLAICLALYRTQRKILKTSIALKKQAPAENSQFIREISIACLSILLLLLFNGNFGHNLYRYTWLVIGAILVRAQALNAKRFHPSGVTLSRFRLSGTK